MEINIKPIPAKETHIFISDGDICNSLPLPKILYHNCLNACLFRFSDRKKAKAKEGRHFTLARKTKYTYSLCSFYQVCFVALYAFLYVNASLKSLFLKIFILIPFQQVHLQDLPSHESLHVS